MEESHAKLRDRLCLEDRPSAARGLYLQGSACCSEARVLFKCFPFGECGNPATLVVWRFQLQTIGSLRFNRDVDGQSCYRQLMAFLNERNSGEFGRCSWQLLMSEYNVDGYIHHIESIRKSVLDIWMEYWQKHCITYMTSESIGMNGMGLPRIYNTLTKNFLIDVENNTWEEHPE